MLVILSPLETGVEVGVGVFVGVPVCVGVKELDGVVVRVGV